MWIDSGTGMWSFEESGTEDLDKLDRVYFLDTALMLQPHSWGMF